MKTKIENWKKIKVVGQMAEQTVVWAGAPEVK